MSQFKTTRRRAGFTLAELLLAVALVAIVAGIGLVFKQRADDRQRFIQSLVMSADGSKIAGAFNDGSMRIWSTTDGKQLHSLGPEKEFFYHPALSADFRFVARPTFLREKSFAIEICDLASGKELRRIEHDGAFCMALSSDGKRLAIADAAIQRIRIVDVDDPQADEETFVENDFGTLFHGANRLMQFSPDDRHLSGMTNDRLVRGDLETKKLHRYLWNYSSHPYTFSPSCMALSPTGKLAAIAGTESYRGFGLPGEEKMQPYLKFPDLAFSGSSSGVVAPNYYRGIAFVDEGRCLVGLSDAGLDFVDPQDGKRQRHVPLNIHGIALAAGREGKLLAIADSDFIFVYEADRLRKLVGYRAGIGRVIPLSIALAAVIGVWIAMRRRRKKRAATNRN